MPREDLVAALSMGSAPQQQGTADPRWQRLMQELLAEEERKQAAFDPYQFGAGGQEMPLAQDVEDPNAKFQGGGASGSWAPEAEPPSTLGEWWEQSTAFRPMAEEAYSAATLPGDVYAGRVDPASDEAIERSFDLAGSLTLGAGAVPAKGMELRAGLGHTYPVEPIRGAAPGSHPALISPSKASVTGPINTEEEYLPTGLANMRRDAGPDTDDPTGQTSRFARNMSLFRNPEHYPGLRPEMTAGGPEEIAENVKKATRSNLSYTLERATPEQWAGAEWYPSARKLIDEAAKNYGYNDAAVAGAFAALSPQKDWDQNIYLAQKVIDLWSNRNYRTWTPEMQAYADRQIEGEAAKSAKQIAAGTSKGKLFLAPIYKNILGKPLSELENPADIGLWIKTYDEAHGDPGQIGEPGSNTNQGYRLYRPDGTFGDYARNTDKSKSKVAWHGSIAIGNAVKSLMSNGDRHTISNAMGEQHKVRSFYNNLLDPYGRSGDVTMDTHAIAGSWLHPKPHAAVSQGLPASEAGIPAMRNSAPLGIQGAYGLYGDVYRDMAGELGMTPAHLQSVIWGTKRDLFANVVKDPKTTAEINQIWKAYHDGLLPLREAQEKVWAIGEQANARKAYERGQK